MKRISIVILLLFFVACRQKKTDSFHITVNKNAVQVAGVPTLTLQGIGHDSLDMKTWQSFFPVCKMPADTDMRNYQEPMPGKYAIANKLIKFTPDTPFTAGQTYFARYYVYDNEVSAADLALHNAVPGKAPYTELIFEY